MKFSIRAEEAEIHAIINDVKVTLYNNRLRFYRFSIKLDENVNVELKLEPNRIAFTVLGVIPSILSLYLMYLSITAPNENLLLGYFFASMFFFVMAAITFIYFNYVGTKSRLILDDGYSEVVIVGNKDDLEGLYNKILGVLGE